jgi:site-specific DNA-methyltransferase (adenine-specific)
MTNTLLSSSPTPLFAGDSWAAYCGDFREVCASWPADSIHLIVTSPPYLVGKEYEKTVGIDDYFAMMDDFYREAYRLLVPGGYAVVNFGEMHNSKSRLYESEVPSTYPAAVKHWEWGRGAGFDLQATRIWRKHFARVGMGFVCNVRPRPSFDFEHIWTWRKRGGDTKEWCADRRLSQRGVIGEDWKSPARLDRHCSAFPVELPDWAIRVHSRNEGDVVLDPFAGSMTTAVAALALGRVAACVDTSDEYLTKGAYRLQEHGYGLCGAL